MLCGRGVFNLLYPGSSDPPDRLWRLGSMPLTPLHNWRGRLLLPPSFNTILVASSQGARLRHNQDNPTQLKQTLMVASALARRGPTQKALKMGTTTVRRLSRCSRVP